MIKVLYSPLVERICVKDGKEHREKAEPEVKYSLREDDKGIEIYFTIRPDQNYKARLNYDDYAGKIIEIALVTTDKMKELKIYRIHHTVSYGAFIRNTPGTDMRIAKVVFEEKNTIVFLCKDSEAIPGFKNFAFDRKKQSATGFIASHSPYFSECLRRRKIKAEMINEVDIYATIAYLEAQVDTLTRIVLSLAPDDNLKGILEWADAYSVLDIKSNDAIIRELQYDKAKVRELQRRYYSAKKTL